MTKLATDIEDLRTELCTRDEEMKTEMKARFEDMLKALTVSHANVDTRLQSVETQALVVNERITAVEKVGEAMQRQEVTTQRQAAVIEATLARVEKNSDEVRKEFERQVHILERDMTNRIDGDGAFQEAINKKVAVVTDTHTVLNTSVQNCSKNLSTFKKEREDKDTEVKKKLDDLSQGLQQANAKECDVQQQKLAVVWLFIGTQKRLVALHSALVGSRRDGHTAHAV
jgi:hypothetical protein